MPEPRMDTPHKCEECKQLVVMKSADWPAFFGHVNTAQDWAAFMHDGLCALCANYLAEFAVMNNRRDLAL